MRKSAMFTAIAALPLGACSFVTPPPAPVAPEPVAAPVEVAAPEAPPQPEAPPPAPPRRPRELRVDGSSIEAFRVSWERLSASLSPAQRADLNDAVARLAFDGYGGGTNLPANLRFSPIVPEMVRERIDGLTYAEIIALIP